MGERYNQIKGRYDYNALVVPPSQFEFNGTDKDEPVCCSIFGCGKILSQEERLFGTHCINHQNLKSLDIAKLIQSKK